MLRDTEREFDSIALLCGFKNEQLAELKHLMQELQSFAGFARNNNGGEQGDTHDPREEQSSNVNAEQIQVGEAEAAYPSLFKIGACSLISNMSAVVILMVAYLYYLGLNA